MNKQTQKQTLQHNKRQTKIKQNILITLFIAIILTISMLPTVQGLIDSPNLSAKLLRYEPVPLQPGQYFTAYIQIENKGAGTATNAAVKIDEQFPFQLIDSNDAYKEIGTLQGKSTYTIEYRMKLDSKAVVGTNTLEIEYTDDAKTNGWKKTKLNFNVKNTNGALQLMSVSIDPEEILPGQKGTITLFIKNNAETTLWNIGTKLNLESTNTPFIPTATTEQNIASIAPGKTEQVKISLKAYPDAQPGYYKIPLTIDYTNDDGQTTTQEDIVGLIVQAEPELKAYLKATTRKNNLVETQIQFVNKGISDLKFLDISMEPNEDYAVIDSADRYIGDLDSDDYRSETFTIQSNKKEITLHMKAEYRDDNNKIYEKNLELTTTLPEEKHSYTGIIILILVLGVIAYLWFKKKNKK